ncbi:MAG TPA: hypothetical protein VJ875_04915 [Pyrinomonadaceae bacterium]|nr:hypothetical protein [Pyrinomonadaceae bacterium]
MKTKRRLKKEYGWLLWPTIITILAVFFAAFLIASDRSGAYNVRIELAKLLIQLVLIVILGGVVSLVIQGFNRRRERNLAWNEFRRTVLSRLIRAYFDTKKARRILETNLVVSANNGEEIRRIPFEVCDSQFECISVAQLELEHLVYELETFDHVFSEENRKSIIQSIRSMEESLSDLMFEYRNLKQKTDSAIEHLDLGTFPKLRAALTVGSPKSSDDIFKEIFVQPFHLSVNLIRKDILKI